jgi:hypothetical protein
MKRVFTSTVVASGTYCTADDAAWPASTQDLAFAIEVSHYSKRPIGKSYEMTVEPYADNTQLESQWLADELEPDADVPMYYDPNPE